MRFFKTWSLPAILISFIFAGAAVAADPVKIGIVEFDRVFETSTTGKSIKAEITAKGKQLETELKKKGTEFETFQKNLEREVLVMDKDMRAKKEEEFKTKLNDLRTLQRSYEDELQELQRRLMGGFQKEVVDIVNQIGKTGKYTAIMEKRGGGVIYSVDAIDITDEVIKRHNALKLKKGK